MKNTSKTPQALLSLAVLLALAVPAFGQGYGESPYIYGIHDPGGENIMVERGKPGWVMITEEVGHDPNSQGGINYRPYADQGLGVIVRINNGYGGGGTIPYDKHYDNFAQRVANFVRNSAGCHIWIIGNEMNWDQEWPRYEGWTQPITPALYIQCYLKVRAKIKAIPGHADDTVMAGAVGTWGYNDQVGDWMDYWDDLLAGLNGKVDGLVLHTYTHGTNPASVTDPVKMLTRPDRHWHFRAYRDYLARVPESMNKLPVYITETDQCDPWADVNSGWVKEAYKEIHNWNKTSGTQKIYALCLYRWIPWADQWGFGKKWGVINDFRDAIDQDYRWDTFVGDTSSWNSDDDPNGEPEVLADGSLRWQNEDYSGGSDAQSNVDYYDTGAGNAGGKYRTHDVDIESCTEGGYNVGWIYAGEWTHHIFSGGGTYRVDVRYAGISNATCHVEVDGVVASGPISLPATGGWQTWRTASSTVQFTVPNGDHNVHFVADSSGFNVNHFTFVPVASNPDLPDVIVESLSVSPANPSDGDPVSFTAVVRNIGAAATPTGQPIGVAFAVNDMQVTWGTVAGPLAAGATVTVPTTGGTWTARNGSHRISAVADDVDRFEEADELNNVRTITLDIGTVVSGPNGEPTVLADGTLHWEGEDYSGGDAAQEGVDYHDITPGNTGGAYRADDVDIENCTEGGCNVGWINNGEWTRYTFTGGGTYEFELRYASWGGSTMHVEVDGNDVTGSIALPATPGWQSFATVTAPAFTVGEGSHVVKLVANADGYNINWFRFKPGSEPPPPPPAQPDLVIDSIAMSPSSPQVGENVTFSCVVRNAGDGATPAGVDIGVGYRIDSLGVSWGSVAGPLAAGASVTVNTTGGPWAATVGSHNFIAVVDDVDRIDESNESNNQRSQAFTVTEPAGPGPDGTPTVLPDGTLHWEAEDYSGGYSAQEGVDYHDSTPANEGGQYRDDAVGIEVCSDGGYNVGWTAPGEWMHYTFAGEGTYEVQVRYAAYSASLVHVQVDGVNASGSITLPSTGGWQNWATIGSSGSFTVGAGTHTVYFIADTSGFNVNWFRFVPVSAPLPPPGQPDVIVESLTVSPSNPEPGQQVTFTSVVRNIGGAATPQGVTIGVGYLVDGLQVTWGSVMGPLAAGEAVTVGTHGGLWTAATGEHQLIANADDINRFAEANESNNTMTVSFTVGSGAAGPDGTPTVLPDGTLHWEAEGYCGGYNAQDGIDYSDTNPTNDGGQYRNDGVDIEVCSEGGYNVGWNNPGEWTRYDFTGSGTYQIQVRYAAYGNGSVHFEIDGVQGPAIALPATGGWQNWATAAGNTVTIGGGSHGVRLWTDQAGHNVNYFRFVPATQPPPGLPDVVVDSISVSPSSPMGGDSVTFSCVVRNIGSAATPVGTPIGVAYHVDGQYVTWGAEYGPLAAGASMTIGTDGSGWLASSGTHTVTAIADDVNRFNEANENNNTRNLQFTVGSTPPPAGGGIFGMNIDPMNPNGGNPTSQELKDAGVRWVRIEWKITGGNSFYDPVFAAHRAAGLKVLLIVDYSTVIGKPHPDASDSEWLTYISRFAREVGQIAAHIGDGVDAWQIWNEPDLAPQPGYDPWIRPNLYGRMLRDTYNAIRQHSSRQIVTAGLCSGNPYYLRDAKNAVGGLYADAVCIHPYGQRAPDNWPDPNWGFGNMSTLINTYYNMFGKQIWLSETGVSTTDQAFQAQYLENVYSLCSSMGTKVGRVFWFCWHNGMVGEYGIFDAAGNPKQSYWRYRQIAGSW